MTPTRRPPLRFEAERFCELGYASIFGQFTDLVSSASGWAYLIVFVLAHLDAVVPAVPSETSVITAGVVASAGDLSLAPIVGAAASGAFLGDNTAYFIGARFGSRIEERFFSGKKARERLKWAQHQVSERGGELIVISRLIPGGRTVVTLSAGTLGYLWRRFVVLDERQRWAGPSTPHRGCRRRRGRALVPGASACI